MLRIRLIIFMMVVLPLLPGRLAAQGPYNRDDGQYVILRAQYGTERRHVDVSNRLRELARRDMRFQVTNENMGSDPDVGADKKLWIVARGPDGRERTFEYREDSTVDGALFRGWNRGDWGEPAGDRYDNRRGGDDGQYAILRAQYGTERRNVDVTNRLRELARRDMRFQVSNENMGSDPDVGADKKLWIVARGPDGRERTFEYREDSTVDGALFRSWNRGDWGEPADDRYDNRRGGDDAQYLILRAQYGTERRHVDVTNRLRELARRDMRFQVSNENMGSDPDKGADKKLWIITRGPDGRERTFEYREDSTVDGALFRGWDRGDWGERIAEPRNNDNGQYLILSAQYGTERKHVDVTRRLRELARMDRPFKASNDNFGVDPDVGADKVLRIFARGPDGREHFFDYREDSMVDGSQFRGWNRGDWGNGGWSGNWRGQGR